MPQRTDELDDLISAWHDGHGEGMALHEYLGLSWEDYSSWVTTDVDGVEWLAPDVVRTEDAGDCWVCEQPATYVDLTFMAPVCGGICVWAAWEAMRLHDTKWRAW